MDDLYLRNDCPCSRCSIDYYGVLSLNKDCTDLEIKQAYRQLAIRHHPGRRKDEGSQIVFSLIAEAYDVLSDPLRKAVYDQYGEEGLKRGVPGPDGFIEPYVFHGEPMRTFRDFFGTDNPYADLLDILAQPLSLLEFPEGRGIKRKEEPLVKSLQLTLSEVFYGGVKKMKIQRLMLEGDDKSSTACQEKILTIPIKPGIPTGTKIVFPETGDQGPARIPADVIFITEDRPHETFQREGSDLYMTTNIFLREALTGIVITVNTIDERTLRIPITSIVTPEYRKVVCGEGLPYPENPKCRGNLILRFDIEFPFYLPVASKEHVKKAFDQSKTGTDDMELVHRLILAEKIRRNIDEDIPLRREPDDEEYQLKVMCDM